MDTWEIILTISLPTLFILILIIYIIYIRFFNKNTRSELKRSKRVPFKVDKLLIALGGAENIVNITSSLSKVKIDVVDIKKVNINHIMKLKQKGVIQQSTSISIIFDNYAETLAKQLRQKIK